MKFIYDLFCYLVVGSNYAVVLYELVANNQLALFNLVSGTCLLIALLLVD